MRGDGEREPVRMAGISMRRVHRVCGARQRFAPGKLCLGDFGPRFAKHLETSQTLLVECPHIGRIAVIELLQNIMHR
jgi:hypothetical protein